MNLPFLKRSRVTRRRFIGMSRSGVLLQDNNAVEVDEELLVDRHSMAFDDDREVPFYEIRRPGMPPMLKGMFHVNTGGSLPIRKDTWWLMQRAQAIYLKAARSFDERKDQAVIAVKQAGMAILAGGILIFLVCLIIVGYGMKTDADIEIIKETNRAAEAQQTPDAVTGTPPAAEGAAPAP